VERQSGSEADRTNERQFRFEDNVGKESFCCGRDRSGILLIGNSIYASLNCIYFTKLVG